MIPESSSVVPALGPACEAKARDYLGQALPARHGGSPDRGSSVVWERKYKYGKGESKNQKKRTFGYAQVIDSKGKLEEQTQFKANFSSHHAIKSLKMRKLPKIK